MRAIVKCALALVSFAATFSGRAIQPAEEALQPPEDIEEVIVRGGKPLSQWRLEMDLAQDELFKLFNALNEGQDNDVGCRDEAPTGSRIPQRACWSHAQQRAGAVGARMFLTELLDSAGNTSGGRQGNAEVGIAQAMSDAAREGRIAEDRFQEEWGRLLAGDQRFAEAVAEYSELKAEFDRFSGATGVSAQQPRQIPLGRTGPQCEASTYTEYQQRNNVASVSGTVGISACPAGTTGSFKLVANVRDDAGAITPIEFSETWQRADAKDHVFNSDYPIGDNVALVSVRVRGLKCTCEDSTQ
jgi:hypothetical protein